jgi:hypothetical protein
VAYFTWPDEGLEAASARDPVSREKVYGRDRKQGPNDTGRNAASENLLDG